MVMQQMIFAVLAIVVGVILITSQASTIATNTDTSAGSALSEENVGSSAVSIYNLYNFIWAVAGLGLIVGGLVVFFSLKPKGK